MANGDSPQFDYQREQIRIEEEKLKIERDKLALESSQKLWTPISLIVSVVVSVFGAAFALYTTQETQREAARNSLVLQQQQAKDDFRLKLSEIVMAGTAHEAVNKLKALNKWFSEDVPTSMIEALDPNKISWGRDSKNQFLDWIAAQPSPSQRRVIVDTYKAAFGQEEWLSPKVEAAATSSSGSIAAKTE